MTFWICQNRPTLTAGAIFHKQRELSCAPNRINNKNDAGSQHNFDWNNMKISHKETNYFKRMIAKMFYIKKEGKNSINMMSDFKDYNASYDIILDHLT